MFNVKIRWQAEKKFLAQNTLLREAEIEESPNKQFTLRINEFFGEERCSAYSNARWQGGKWFQSFTVFDVVFLAAKNWCEYGR